jgi:hypothetical protein
MELREWKYMNPPASAQASTTTSNVPKARTQKERFADLLEYMKSHKSSSTSGVGINEIRSTGFDYVEYRTDLNGENHKIQAKAFYGVITTRWRLEIYKDDVKIEEISGKSYEELLEALRPYFSVPNKRSTDYNKILETLNEWKYMNPPTSSSGYKKRFEKLIKYHIDHASSELERVNNKVINEYDFHLSEHYNTGSDEFNRTIIVSVNKYTDEFFLSIFVDGKEVYHNVYKSYEEVLEILTDTYMFLPDEGTQDYDSLLTESLSIADDFKLYENLWEDVDVEEYNMVLGRTSYNLYDDSDLDAYLTQSARLMRKLVGNEKPLEFFKLQKINMMLRTPKYYTNKKLADKLLIIKAELENKLT